MSETVVERIPVPILYTNWRGETAVRKIVPHTRHPVVSGKPSLWFGSTQWHPEPQWLLTAVDVDKGAVRDWALSGIKAWGEEAVSAALASTAGAGAEPQVIRDIARMVGEKVKEIRLVIDRHTSPRGPGIYMASKTAHAPEWRRLRAEGLPIISTWIDEAGKGETACFTDLWQRCLDEAATASVVIVYRQPGEVLKGAFVEAGAALACGVPVLAVGCDEFSFSNHAGVERLGTLHAALDRARQILVEMPATKAPAVLASPRSGAGEGEDRSLFSDAIEIITTIKANQEDETGEEDEVLACLLERFEAAKKASALSQGGGAGRSEKGEGEGRGPSGPGSREPSPHAVSASGFDPSRTDQALYLSDGDDIWPPARTVAYVQQELHRIAQDLNTVGEDLTDEQPKAISWLDVAYGRVHNCISVLKGVEQRLTAPAQAIEAHRAETHSGSVEDESAVHAVDAPGSDLAAPAQSPSTSDREG